MRLPPDQPGRKLGGDGAFGRGAGDEIVGVRPMRDGDDPRDIYWRKSTMPTNMVLRERARETRRDVELSLDPTHPGLTPAEDWSTRFERRIRDVASRAVAHIKRGDGVTVRCTTGDRVRADATVGADPLLRFLALLEATPGKGSLPPKSSATTLPPEPKEAA